MPRGIYTRKSKTIMSKTIDVTSDAIEGREREFTIAQVAAGEAPVIEVAPAEALREVKHLDNQMFMKEMLEVYLHEPVSENEPKHVFVGVNGDSMWLLRGNTYQLKRYHVAVLAQAKSGRVSQRKLVAPDGSQSYVEKETLSLMYPFSVTNDPNPAGRQWLQETMKRAG